MRAEKIESGVYSYFSAPIFLPAFLTNGHNSLSRELLLRIQLPVDCLRKFDQKKSQAKMIEDLHGRLKPDSLSPKERRLRNPTTRSIFPIPDEPIEPAIVAARIFLRARLSGAALCLARSLEKRRRQRCSTTAPLSLSAQYKISRPSLRLPAYSPLVRLLCREKAKRYAHPAPYPGRSDRIWEVDLLRPGSLADSPLHIDGRPRRHLPTL